ncbi:hypothetical protein T06_199 [Trichinella sp. T6]|nr:hypothetical protein T06_6199 [Trichinella sp. T6]KRX85363.1 hypothetical protein T06_199 [Trichinella sp. T6]
MKFNINAPSVLLPYHKLDKTRNSNSIESSGVYKPCNNSVRIEKDKLCMNYTFRRLVLFLRDYNA